MNSCEQAQDGYVGNRGMDSARVRELSIGEALDRLITETRENLDRLEAMKRGMSLDYLGRPASVFPMLRGQTLWA